MALQKQPLSITFARGVDTKTDPFQIPLGKFQSLKNSVFTTTGRLTKRNGFSNITNLPNTDQTTLTTLNDNLVATGTNLYAFSQDTSQWLNQGTVQPIRLDVQSIVRSTTSQVSPDAAIASNGLVCTTYTDNGLAYYQVSDSATGQQIVNRIALPDAANYARAFVLGNYFIITFISVIAATPTLRYIALPTAMPSTANAPVTISADLQSAAAGYDAYSIDDLMFISWGKSTAAIATVSLTRGLALSTAVNETGNTANLVSVTVDQGNAVVWVTYWEDSSNNGYTVAYNYTLGKIVNKTQIINNVEIAEITSVSVSNVLSVFYENIHNYSYTDSIGDSIRTDFISKLTVTKPVTITTGIVSATTVMVRSVGLASKAFIADNNLIYMLIAYGDTNQTNALDNSNQPSYFLIDSTGHICMRLAYSNGGGYEASQILPNVTTIDGVYYVPYLITDFLTTVNKGTNLPAGTPSNALYTQTGVNLALFQLDTAVQHSSEIASALHLTGGQLWEFDGVRPVEHGFQVWPENVVVGGNPTVGGLTAQEYFYQFTYEWTDNAGNLHRSAPSIPVTYIIVAAPANFTADTTNTSATLVNVSSFTGLQVGQHITGTGIPANTYIVSLDSGTNTLVMSAAASATNSTVTITPATLTSLAINVPTLRLTYKIAPNPVRIVGYRWSTAQQTYYQFTSVTSPVVNDTTTDSVVMIDSKSDEQILGQTLLYTTGGVLENISAPASVDSALFSNRLFLIDAEDRNLLWFSKQVIQNVPVEMSDLLTLYIAPTTGAQGSTGAVEAISAMDDKLVIFKKSAIYYINGAGPDNTGANSTFSDPVFVTGTVGSANPNSVVLIPNGLMFQSDKGIWLLGRDLSTTYIGADVEAFNNNLVLSATAIPGTNEVRFILDDSTTLMYDYFFNAWAIHSNVSAISATLYQNAHTYLNRYGQVFQETPGTYLDGSTPVLMSLITSWINIAGLQGFERFYFANLLGTYYTPFKLNFEIGYDYNPTALQSTLITPDNNTPAYGGEALWGSGQPWGGPGNVFSARLFPQKQKCQSFQVTINEVYDPSLGVSPGQGLSLSGLALIVGMKRGFRTQKASRSFG